ncbi:hypothetical protein LCGC14_0554190 [marine sediment metagenome]|uniref:Uncharacterized protein n=1 Tax=marine sediment metagenome TaxID=412755 RepID=A0A0F9RNV3_9ZZZZ|nr:MAG: hypothetical protein Lokiarch_27450 [Candidatus Lokiarchaeum sp. GC14_75]
MPKEIKGLIISRLVVLFSIILVPIAIFLIYNLVDFDLWFAPNNEQLKFGIIKLLSPIVFSVSWLFFLILFAERFSDTLDDFDETISVVPSRLKFFYGINAIYILFIFIFPIISPIVSVLSFASFAWRLTTFKKKRWEEDSKVSVLTWVMMSIAAILPIFCSIVVLPEYIKLADFLWNDLWVPNLDLLFTISYSLFTALAIGSLIILFLNSGISEYEQIIGSSSQKQTFLNVKILEIFLFGFFIFLDLYNFPVIDFFYLLGFVIIIFISVVNFFRGKSKFENFKSHFIGYLIATIFIGSNVIFSNSGVSEFLRVWSLVISAILYIFIFFYTFLSSD